MTANSKYISYSLPSDDMPIDLSFIYKDERPAGKHGFLTVKQDKFVFEDGTEAKFWGTNFNSAANFPTKQQSEQVARRLAKVGINMVRLHQLDAEWSTPNIFQFTKGEKNNTTQEFDLQSLDRLDYLIHCLKQQGIYVFLDLLCYRKFTSGDDVREAHKLEEAAKPYSNFDRRLIDLQKQFNHDIWTHVNPYTTLAYKDDPAIALVCLTNENDLFFPTRSLITLEPYRSELEERYRKWAKDNNVSVGEEKVDFAKPKTPPADGVFNITAERDVDIVRFLCQVQKYYYIELIEHLRQIGVKIPINPTNCTINGALLSSQLVGDFTDSHAYWWAGNQKKFFNGPMVCEKSNIMQGQAMIAFRVLDKPFFVSEWDQPWPNEWRAEAPLFMAAVGALQGWSGFIIHTYRYNAAENVDRLGRDIALGDSYYRGMFDTFNDPAKFGLFYHAALLFRRGDVKTSEKSIAVEIEDLGQHMRYLVVGESSKDYASLGRSRIQALELTVEQQKIGSLLPGQTNLADRIVGPDENVVDDSKGEVVSNTEQLYRNWEKKIGHIDTPRTKVVYGFLGGHGNILLNDLKINVETDFAVIAISSLTDDPLNNSSNILLTTVGRADNTDCKYNEDHTVQLESGHGPVQIEVIEAGIELKTRVPNLRIWSVNNEGFLTGIIPSEYKNGVLSFEVGKEYESMYYLIQTQ